MGISMKMPPKSVTWLVGQSATMGVAGEDEAAEAAGAAAPELVEGADVEAAAPDAADADPDELDAADEVDAAPEATPELDAAAEAEAPAADPAAEAPDDELLAGAHEARQHTVRTPANAKAIALFSAFM